MRSWLISYFIFWSIALTFYADGFGHFFYQDDLFHFFIAQAHSLSDVVAFFNPINEYGYQIYRPLGTQVVFWLMKSLFGLNHHAFHFFIIMLLSCNTTLLYKLLRQTINSTAAFLLSLIYLTHHQNIGVVYFLSVVQLSLALLYTLLSLHLIRQQKPGWQWQSYLLYIATLLSQEIALLNALILPIWLYIQSPQLVRRHWRYIVILLVTMLAYLGMRLYFINHHIFSDNTHYAISLHLSSILNNVGWYGLWFLSVPEYVINFVGSGLRPLPPLFNQYAKETWLSISILLTSIAALSSIIRYNFWKKFWQHIWYPICFILSLGPVLVFPWHKYVYHLPIASVFLMLWLAQFIAWAEQKNTYWVKRLLPLSLLIVLFGSVSTNLIDRTTSYNYQRGQLAAHLHTLVDWEKLRQGQHTILVKNDPTFQVFSADWGNTSSQAKIILKDDLFFKLVSGNPNLTVKYEDDLDETTRTALSKNPDTYLITAPSQ